MVGILTRPRPLFEQLHAALLRAPEMISDSDPARHDYYALVGRLDEAIDEAISNSYLDD